MTDRARYLIESVQSEFVTQGDMGFEHFILLTLISSGWIQSLARREFVQGSFYERSVFIIIKKI